MKFRFFLILIWFSGYTFSQELNRNSNDIEYSYQYALIEASRQKMIGNINEAIKLYQSCISANPKCDVAYYELGTVYSAMGENSKAEDILGQAFELSPQNYWYGIAYSELLKENKKNSKSLKILKKTKRNNKENAITIDFKIAELYSDAEKYDKTIRCLRRIEKEYGLSEMISFKLFETYKLKKDSKSALNVISTLIQKAPDVSEYYVLLGEYYVELGMQDVALKAYLNAYQVDSSNIYAVTNLADLYTSQGQIEKGFYYLNQAFQNKSIPVTNKVQTMIALNKDRDLIKEYSNSIEQMVTSLLIEYPENFDVKMVAYDYYNGIENHKKALEIARNLLESKKDDYIIWQQAIYNASMLEDYQGIITISEEALKYFPNKLELYLFAGMAYSQISDYEHTYNLLSQNINLIKDNQKLKIQFLEFLSEASYRAGKKSESYVYYDELLKLDPENDYSKNNYSYFLAMDSVDLYKAKNLSYSTILKFPENSSFLDTYAWILFRLGDYSNAKFYSEKAIIINAASDPDIIFHYAEILFYLQDYVSSGKYYKLAMEKGYDKDIIENRLNKVYEKF